MSATLKTKSAQLASAAPSREVLFGCAVSAGDVWSLTAEALPVALVGDRLLAYQSMRLLTRLDRDLLAARAQWNQDWFRRLMRIRRMAVERLRRRWQKLTPAPSIRLGQLRRHYHANLASYLYEPRS